MMGKLVVSQLNSSLFLNKDSFHKQEMQHCIKWKIEGFVTVLCREGEGRMQFQVKD